MRSGFRVRLFPVACAAALAWAAGAAGQTLTVRSLAEGLQEPAGAAVHPITGEVYVSEKGSGRILVLKNGRPEPALAPGWKVSEILPRWAISPDMPMEKWMQPVLNRPGPISISTNGTLFVAEQVPNGRILEFRPDGQGQYAVARCVPVPWLDQEFMWRDLFVDPGDRLYIVGADEVGSEFMKFGSALMRETDGNWWVIDFGPFANFNTFAISERQDVMLLGDRPAVTSTSPAPRRRFSARSSAFGRQNAAAAAALELPAPPAARSCSVWRCSRTAASSSAPRTRPARRACGAWSPSPASR